MKHLMLSAAPLVLSLSVLISQDAAAAAIVGEISFAGSYTVNNSDLSLATAFTSFSGVTVGASPTGDYAGLAGAAVTHNPFVFSPFPGGGVTPLWSLTATPSTMFDLATLSKDFANATTLLLSGTGTAYMSTRDATPGKWVLSANTLGTTFTFSSTNSSTGVPDGGATVALLGMALCGLQGLRRKFGSAKL